MNKTAATEQEIKAKMERALEAMAEAIVDISVAKVPLDTHFDGNDPLKTDLAKQSMERLLTLAIENAERTVSRHADLLGCSRPLPWEEYRDFA